MEYVTVSQYAQMVGKDPGNIRRMLIKGVLTGSKIGNQWVLPKDTVFPADRRVKTGKYRNWRKRTASPVINSELMTQLLSMSTALSGIYGSELQRIVLYGSYARGSQTSESDIDIALFLNGEDSDILHERMTDLVVDYELELGVTLSVVIIEYEQYQQWKNTLPYFQNISREGIVLWKAV